MPTGPLLLAVDETLERRWGEKIEALGVYRDPVRSSHGHFVKAKGLRWVSLKLLAACQGLKPPVTFLTRLRLDAVLHDPPPPRQPSLQAVLTDPATVWPPLTQRWPDGTQRHLQAATGTALWYHPGQPTVALRWRLLRDPTGQQEPRALLSTDPDGSPKALLATYLQRWQVEVTFQEVRTHLGVETQRQWSAAAIARTTPVLLGLFSWLILVAHHLRRARSLRLRRAAWYAKTRPRLRRRPGLCPPPPLDPDPAFFDVPGHP
ncbi:MAG: hypothetical protein OXG36_13785 [Caldilineaceae bacterium]|nr:hypothetical protein [Caldilineaceae bacterium]